MAPLNYQSLRVGPYELQETLGEGNFGTVRRALHLSTNVYYAVKVVEKDKLQRDLPRNLDIRREMSILRAINHPNIVHLHEVMTSAKNFYLVMDLAAGGDFFHMISNTGRLSEPLARKYFRQLVNAISHCHSLGVFHRDLKPENILLTEAGDLKVTDFGFSAMKDHGQVLLKTSCGSPHYCAPEVWNGSQNGYEGRKSDAFSIGVVLFVLLTAEQPFAGSDDDRVLQKVNKCDVKYPNYLSADAVDMLKKLLIRDPKKRWDLKMVKRHPFYLTGSLPPEQADTLLDDYIPMPDPGCTVPTNKSPVCVTNSAVGCFDLFHAKKKNRRMTAACHNEMPVV